MYASRWAKCALRLSATVVPFFFSGATLAQTAGNSPKLEKQLQQVAKAITRKEYGPVVQTGAVAADHMLVVNYEPAAGIDRAEALKSMREVSWDRVTCNNKDAVGFLVKEHVTIKITLTQADQTTQTIADVTETSCAREASIEPSMSRMIGGIAFAPRPTLEQALARVQAYVSANFFDPDAAQIKCAEPGPAAWIKPVLERRRYGYFVNCSINGKNRFGGYVGFEPHIFRMNGDEFELVTLSGNDGGLMEPTK